MARFFSLCVFMAFVGCSLQEDDKVNAAGHVFQYGDNVYKVVLPQNDKRSWLEAEEICKHEESGHLVSFGDKKERAWMQDLLTNLTREMDPIGRFWIGATDPRIQKVYEYVDGTPFRSSEAPWAKGEPNRPKTSYQYCIAMDHGKRGFTWSDNDCYESYGYICKSKGIPKRFRDDKIFGFKWDWNFYIYKFVPLPADTMTWSEAELYCKEAELGHLLSIQDSEESEFIKERIIQIRYMIGIKGFWIGATDIFQLGNFMWTDKTPMKFTKWIAGEPSNYSPKTRREREACGFIHTNPEWGKWSDESCISKKPFICKAKKCSGKLDLVFIVDASGSVRKQGFKDAKAFMWQVINYFNITNNNTRVGLIRFSDFADMIFPMDRYNSPAAVKQAIFKMVFVQGHTKTERALNLAREKMFTKEGGARDLVPKVAIVMTDGKSKRPKWVATAAKQLRAKGVHLVAFGIGKGIDKRELRSMASSPDHVLTVDSYAKLSSKIYELREKICDEIIAAERKRLKALEELYQKEQEARLRG